MSLSKLLVSFLRPLHVRRILFTCVHRSSVCLFDWSFIHPLDPFGSPPCLPSVSSSPSAPSAPFFPSPLTLPPLFTPARPYPTYSSTRASDLWHLTIDHKRRWWTQKSERRYCGIELLINFVRTIIIIRRNAANESPERKRSMARALRKSETSLCKILPYLLLCIVHSIAHHDDSYICICFSYICIRMHADIISTYVYHTFVHRMIFDRRLFFRSYLVKEKKRRLFTQPGLIVQTSESAADSSWKTQRWFYTQEYSLIIVDQPTDQQTN